MAPGQVSVELLAGDRREAAAHLWVELEQSGTLALSCSWAWTGTWLRHYGDVVRHRFAVAYRGGEPRGVALVTESRARRRGLVPLRTVHLGTAGEPTGEGIYVECNRLLVEPEDRDAFATELVRTLVAERNWDEFLIDGFEADDAAALLRADVRFVPRYEPSPVADLRAARDSNDATSLLRKGVRQRVRRSLRGFGEIETEWADSPKLALDVLDELIRLHERRWRDAGRPGAFASERAVAFHRELVPILLEREAAVLFRARGSAGTIGCVYGWVDRGRFLFYQSGFGVFEDARLKPGLVTHALCMQACLERGLDEYDFLAGESRYKRELAATEHTLVWARATRRTPRMTLANVTTRTGRAVRRVRSSGE